MDYHLIPRSHDRNYTGFLTKTIVYTGTFVLFLASFALTISSIAIPKWITYHHHTDPPLGPSFHYSYGLHRRCSSLTRSCEPFPQQQDCHAQDRYFCSMWRSVGFLMSFAVVLEGLTVVSYVIIIGGSKMLRENGWKVLSLVVTLGSVVQAVCMAIVAYLFDNEDRFFVGWKLDKSWIFCTVSWCLGLICAVSMVVAAYTLPSEGGYELIPDRS